VKPANRDHLEDEFCKAVKHPPHGLIQACLIQCQDRKNYWQIIAMWRSREAYEEEQSAAINHAGIELFCEDGSVPEREFFNVVDHYLRV
jgi:hypothetical protein